MTFSFLNRESTISGEEIDYGQNFHDIDDHRRTMGRLNGRLPPLGSGSSMTSTTPMLNAPNYGHMHAHSHSHSHRGPVNTSSNYATTPTSHGNVAVRDHNVDADDHQVPTTLMKRTASGSLYIPSGNRANFSAASLVFAI